MSALHVLYIVPHVPNLTKIRAYMQVRGLIESGQQVTVATLTRSPADHKHIEKLTAMGASVIAAPLGRAAMMRNAVAALPTTQPLQSRLLWSDDLMQQIEAHLREHPADIIHVEHLRMAAYGLRLTQNWPVVWDAVDNLASLFQQTARAGASWQWRLMARLEAPRLPAYERSLTGQFPATLVISRRDLAAFQQKNSHAERVRYAPLGIPMQTSGNDLSRADKTIIITGTMNYHPNVAAVNHFVDVIFPYILRQVPDVQLQLVGANPVKSIQSYNQHLNVTVTGFVPSVTDYLKQATVALAPVTYGAGIQIKVLEAFLAETPLVATSMAVRGLDVHHEQQLLIADNPSQFADAVVHLLNTPQLRHQLTREGRRYVESHHDIDVTTRQLLDIYRSVMG